jgi:hypothetical protein
VAYALGVNPMTATPAVLPCLRQEGDRLVYAYQRSKHALGTGYRVYLAPTLAAAVWSMPESGLHRKVSETAEAEIWELSLPIAEALPQGFLMLEIWRAVSPISW